MCVSVFMFFGILTIFLETGFSYIFIFFLHLILSHFAIINSCLLSEDIIVFFKGLFKCISQCHIAAT